jgi:histidine ammonia-lyase
LWVTPESVTENEEPYQWISGGNFLAMHMAESLDRIRKILLHIVKQNDRHLARLVHPLFNRGLPANLSDKNAVSQATFKGLQTQMGMFEVYSSLLVYPASTAFGTHEEFNQDITSHAPASSILARELMQIAKLATATNFIAACQAIDLRGGSKLLSPATKYLYDWLRQYVPYIKKEQPLGHYVEKVAGHLTDNEFLGKVVSVIVK